MTTLFEKDDGNAGLEELEAAIRKSQIRLRMRERASAILSPLAAVVALIAIWELLTRLFEVPTYLIPRPGLVALALSEHFELILKESWVTTSEILLGYALSIVVGIPLALAIFLWPPFARAIYPLLVSSQAMPKVAVAPLLIVWFGFGLLPKVLIAFLIAFFPIVINTVVGLAAIEQEKILLARSMGMNGAATFFKIRLPNALPSIFGGLKISITLAVVGAVVGEFVGGNGGLGYQLMVANGSMDTPLLFAGLIALTVLGIVFFMLVEVVERLCVRHRSMGTAGARESM
ncbi:MAG: NitT/TauT family transport system permease protein [Rhodospirillaceae bacterium]|jgi:NitT/TauT family transport system permease protein|nr:NitT/TauT family transport system permease protein [Rhodospirillaceae bacterium]MEA2908242.1 NitT/TauT family transport system permease protein [Bradyrhizobium sp.]